MSEFWNEFKNGLNKSRLLNPFITTDAERVRNQQTELADKQTTAQLTNFNRDQEYQAKLQKHKLWEVGRAKTKASQSDEIYKENRELKKLAIETGKRNNRIAGYNEKKLMIGEHSKMAMQNLVKSAENATADMTDVERGDLFKSKEFRDQHQFATFGRLAGNVLKSKTPEEKARNMELVNQYAGEHGYTITEKDGQYHLSGENVPGLILNEQNFAQINNAVAEQFANEIKIRKQLIGDKATVYGVGRIHAINRITAVLPEDEKGSWSKASKIFAGIGKDMNKADVNVYSLRQNITKFLDDGAIDERERQALLQNMAILADSTGTKYELGADGNPMVIKEDGSRINLKQFAEELQSRDKLGNAIDQFEEQSKAMQTAQERVQKTVKEMDVYGVLNLSTYPKSVKAKFQRLLIDLTVLADNPNTDVMQLKKVWDDYIGATGVDSKHARFPFAEEYYPKAISEADNEIKARIKEDRRLKLTSKEQFYTNGNDQVLTPTKEWQKERNKASAKKRKKDKNYNKYLELVERRRTLRGKHKNIK